MCSGQEQLVRLSYQIWSDPQCMWEKDFSWCAGITACSRIRLASHVTTRVTLLLCRRVPDVRIHTAFITQTLPLLQNVSCSDVTHLFEIWLVRRRGRGMKGRMGSFCSFCGYAQRVGGEERERERPVFHSHAHIPTEHHSTVSSVEKVASSHWYSEYLKVIFRASRRAGSGGQGRGPGSGIHPCPWAWDPQDTHEQDGTNEFWHMSELIAALAW